MPPAATAAPQAAPALPSASQAYQSLSDFNNSRETPQAATDAADTKYGVTGLASQLDQLRGITGNLQTAIGNVAPSVAGRTSGSLVTQAQRDAITNNETQPLTDQFNKVSTNLNDVNSQLTNAQGLASTYAGNLLTSDQQKYNDLFGQYTNAQTAEANTAAAAEKQREFDATLAEQVAARKQAASTANPGLDLGALLGSGAAAATAAGTPASTINHTRNASGGYSFTTSTGQPVTMGQYLSSQGLSGNNLVQAAAKLLTNSNGGDKGIANAISSGHYSPAQLQQLFPQVFGGI